VKIRCYVPTYYFLKNTQTLFLIINYDVGILFYMICINIILWKSNLLRPIIHYLEAAVVRKKVQGQQMLHLLSNYVV